MTPLEFNKIGAQVQLEIFERYFEDLNQQIRIPQTDTDYADRVVSIDEKISIFKRFGNTAYSNGSFSLPLAQTTATQSFQTTGNASYTITNISASQLADQATVTLQGNEITGFTFTGNVMTFGAASIPAASVLNTTVTSGSVGNSSVEIQLLNTNFQLAFASGFNVSNNNFATTGVPTVVSSVNSTVGGFDLTTITMSSAQNYQVPSKVSTVGTLIVSSTSADLYKLGTVVYTNGALPQQEVERVDRGQIFHLNSSNLTKPSTSYPVYLYENNRLIVYPTSIQSGISASYIKKPSDPNWGFVLSTNGSYAYSGVSSVDFELHPTEQTEIILKTLLYAGVVIKDPQIIQVAAQEVAQQNINQQR